MKIATLNANGLRSAAKKGVVDWLSSSDLAICCLQEIRIQHAQLSDELLPAGWHACWYPALRPGYSGTAILSRSVPDHTQYGLQFDLCDSEGRWLECHFASLVIVSLYLPSGSANDAAQVRKDEFLERLLPILQQKLAADPERSWIICGDFNIAHQEIDLKNWKSNQKNSGFLPHERSWFSQLLNDLSLIDAFRTLNPEPNQYTWWSQRGNAYANNIGWRIDYQIVSSTLLSAFRSTQIVTTPRFSDHAPLIVEYTL